jgi:dethiobiotin synthetase
MNVNLTKPGLFITATDTEVGKTVITCAIAVALRQAGLKVGASKPIASGCRLDREGLISEDAEALAHFSDSRLPLTVVNPVRYRAPVAPAVAAELTEEPVDEAAIAEALGRIERVSDVMLIEGIGGLMTPISESRTVLDLAVDIGYPVLVVTRNKLGTLSHTAMTCKLIRDAGLRLAGLVINQYDPDTTDVAEFNNSRWLTKQNGTPVLATVPRVEAVDVASALLPPSVLEAVAMTDWRQVCRGAGAGG